MIVDRLLRSGVDPGTAATLTGHSVVVMLKFYQQVTEDDRRAAVELAALGDTERGRRASGDGCGFEEADHAVHRTTGAQVTKVAT